MSQHPAYKSKRITNKGGFDARKGFTYQDHIAALYCLKMLSNPNLVEVASETEDDIVLGWKEPDDSCSFEFVQVKHVNIGQAWTISELVNRELFNKSFQNDQWKEHCRFRLVTSWGVDSTLNILQFPKASPARKPEETRVKELIEGLEEKCLSRKYSLQSPKGNPIAYWVKNCEWEVFHSAKDVENTNLATLDAYCDQINAHLTAKQRRELYDKLITLIQTTAVHDSDISIEEKCLRSEYICSFIKQEALKRSNSQDVASPFLGDKQQQAIAEVIQSQLALLQPSIAPILDNEHKSEMDHAEMLIKKRRPKEAIEYLVQLEKRLRQDSDNGIRYRLYSLKGNAHYILRDNELAAESFLKAFSFNPKSDRAMSNRAFGLFLIGKTGEAVAVAYDAIKLNAALPDAYAVLLIASDPGVAVSELIKLVPETIRDSLEVSYTLAHLHSNEGDHEQSISRLRALNLKDADTHLDVASSLATELIRSVDVDRTKLVSGQLTTDQETRVKEARDIFDKLIDKIKGTDYESARFEWFFNRASARRILGDLDGAMNDLAKALSFRSEPRMLFHRALLEYEVNQINDSIATLNSLLETDEANESRHLLAMVLHSKGETNEGIQHLQTLLTNHPTERLELIASQSLFRLLIDAGKHDDATQLLGRLRSRFPESLSAFICEYEYFKKFGKIDESKASLRAAKEIASKVNNTEELYFYAQALFDAQLFEDAISIFLLFIQQDGKSNANRQLLWCYHKTGKIDKALELCRSVRSRYNVTEWFTKFEISWLLDIDDINQALPLAEQYLIAFPNEHDMRVSLSSHYAKVGKFSNALSIIPKFQKLDSMPLHCWIGTVQVLEKCKSRSEAIALAYEIRRYFHKSEQAHLCYLWILNREEHPVVSLEQVKIDCALKVQRTNGQYEWFIIEERKDDDYRTGELPLEHTLAQRFLGKRVGDQAIVRESIYGSESVRIEAIIPKYVFAYQQTLEKFEEWFPSSQALWKIDNALELDADGVPKILRIMEKTAWARYEIGNRALEMYSHKQFPLGTMVGAIGERDPINAWFALTALPKIGIHSCFEYGSKTVMNSTELFQSSDSLVLDVTALLSIAKTNAWNVVEQCGKRLCVVQSTIDVIRKVLEDKQSFRERGAGTVGIFGGKVGILTPDLSLQDEQISILIKLSEWIAKHCSTLTLEPSLTLTAEKRRVFGELLGDCFADSIFAALHPRHTLYSDDAMLRSFAKSELGVTGIWSQALFAVLHESKKIESLEYNQLVINLALLNYRYTSIDKNSLLLAVQNDGWKAGLQFSAVCKYLSSESLVGSCAEVLTNFFFDLYQALPTKLITRQSIVVYALHRATHDRSFALLKKFLKASIEQRFGSLYTESKSDLIGVIDDWEKTRSIEW